MLEVAAYRGDLDRDPDRGRQWAGAAPGGAQVRRWRPGRFTALEPAIWWRPGSSILGQAL